MTKSAQVKQSDMPDKAAVSAGNGKAAAQVSVINMYAPREEIYPREIKGRYATLRWVCVWLTQLMFYGQPWISWDGRQAVLFVLFVWLFFFFGFVFWLLVFFFFVVFLF